MLKLTNSRCIGRLILGGVLSLCLVGPAVAGNVYSWVTEDGTHAFTDDPKRIPAMHRGEAKARPLGDLKRYGRYTVDRTGKGYTDRLEQRRSDLRERAQADAAMANSQVYVAGANGQVGRGLTYNVPMSGGRAPGGQRGVGMQLPLGNGMLGGNDEPISVESVRMKPENGQATRHWTIVKQGDRVVAVIKGENRDRSPEGFSESDFE